MEKIDAYSRRLLPRGTEEMWAISPINRDTLGHSNLVVLSLYFYLPFHIRSVIIANLAGDLNKKKKRLIFLNSITCIWWHLIKRGLTLVNLATVALFVPRLPEWCLLWHFHQCVPRRASLRKQPLLQHGHRTTQRTIYLELGYFSIQLSLTLTIMVISPA